MARRIVRGAVALFALIAWAIPCHDREAAAAARQRQEAKRVGHAGQEAEPGATGAKAPGAAGVAAVDSASARRDIDAGNSSFMKAWLTGDADLFANCFAADGAMLRPGGRIIAGRDSIRVRMQSAFQQFRAVSAVATTEDVFIVGDCVYETGKWVVAAGPVGRPASAEPDSGSYVQIWKKEGAAWKLWRNVNVE